ncbi:hypothetical protein BC828DRAFT_400959 [Blastocladiella britannica]|nr:hypothetical protein BC828DRAFT_400959 [Blastocladiella britannica]
MGRDFRDGNVQERSLQLTSKEHAGTGARGIFDGKLMGKALSMGQLTTRGIMPRPTRAAIAATPAALGPAVPAPAELPLPRQQHQMPRRRSSRSITSPTTAGSAPAPPLPAPSSAPFSSSAPPRRGSARGGAVKPSSSLAPAEIEIDELIDDHPAATANDRSASASPVVPKPPAARRGTRRRLSVSDRSTTGSSLSSSAASSGTSTPPDTGSTTALKVRIPVAVATADTSAVPSMETTTTRRKPDTAVLPPLSVVESPADDDDNDDDDIAPADMDSLMEVDELAGSVDGDDHNDDHNDDVDMDDAPTSPGLVDDQSMLDEDAASRTGVANLEDELDMNEDDFIAYLAAEQERAKDKGRARRAARQSDEVDLDSLSGTFRSLSLDDYELTEIRCKYIVGQGRKRARPTDGAEILTEEEQAIRRTELTRRRTLLQQQRAAEEKDATIHRLLKKQAGKKSRSERADEQRAEDRARDEEARVREMVRYVQRAGVPASRSLLASTTALLPLAAALPPVPTVTCSLSIPPGISMHQVFPGMGKRRESPVPSAAVGCDRAGCGADAKYKLKLTHGGVDEMEHFARACSLDCYRILRAQ